MEREYGVVMCSRSGQVMIKVIANGTREARKAVQAKIPPGRIGRFGGQVYTSVFVSRLESFVEGYRAKFISLDDAVGRVASDGFITMGA